MRRTIKLLLIGGFLIVLVTVFLVISLLFGLFDKKNQKSAVKEVYLQYTSDYKILEESDGAIQLSVTCPNFEEITKQMAKEEMEITSQNLKKAIKDSSVTEKEYIFTVDEMTEEAINKAFLEKVAYDLMVTAIKEVEYQESWGLEE